MALLVSCLEGPALNWLKPFYQSDPDGVLVTSSKFVEEITKQYGDSHKEVTAGINLKTLRQGNRSVAAYASDFRNLVHDLGFNDAALRYHFREGLNESVKDDLSGCISPANTLEDLIIQAGQLDNRRYERRVERKVTGFTQSGTAAVVPMEIGALSKGKLTPEEKQRRFRLGLCLYCGEPGHRAIECSSKPSTIVPSQ